MNNLPLAVLNNPLAYRRAYGYASGGWALTRVLRPFAQAALRAGFAGLRRHIDSWRANRDYWRTYGPGEDEYQLGVIRRQQAENRLLNQLAKKRRGIQQQRAGVKHQKTSGSFYRSKRIKGFQIPIRRGVIGPINQIQRSYAFSKKRRF